MRNEALEVGFGDVFRSSYSPEPLKVVIDVDEKAAHASAIHCLDDGRELIVGLPGTTTHGDIGDIVDHWDLERIRGGLILGCQISFQDRSPLIETMIEIVTKDIELRAQKPPVILRPK